MSGTTDEAAAKAPIEALRTVGRPGLAPLWTAARERLERNGRVLGGRPVVLRDPLVATRDRVAALLGELRRPTGDVPVSLARLDAALRASRFGLGLLEVLEALDGQPVRDRRAERTAAKDTLGSLGGSWPRIRRSTTIRGWPPGSQPGRAWPARGGTGLAATRSARPRHTRPTSADGVNRAELLTASLGTPTPSTTTRP